MLLISMKLTDMEHNEGRELVEYALIAVLVSLGITLMLNGAGDQIANIWNLVASFVLG
jgi:Flp pilus assembly pilin Flp